MNADIPHMESEEIITRLDEIEHILRSSESGGLAIRMNLRREALRQALADRLYRQHPPKNG